MAKFDYEDRVRQVRAIMVRLDRVATQIIDGPVTVANVLAPADAAILAARTDLAALRQAAIGAGKVAEFSAAIARSFDFEGENAGTVIQDVFGAAGALRVAIQTFVVGLTGPSFEVMGDPAAVRPKVETVPQALTDAATALRTAVAKALPG